MYKHLKTAQTKQSVMKNKDRLHDELHHQAPFLNELKKGQDPYRVPADYFDKLEPAVYRQLEAIGATRKPATRTAGQTSFWQILQKLWRPRVALALAGVLAVVVAAWWYFAATPAGTPGELAAAKITADDAEAYLLDNLMELDPGHIALVLPEESLPPITIDLAPGNNQQNARPASPEELQLSPEDLDNLLRDMTDEELKDLML